MEDTYMDFHKVIYGMSKKPSISQKTYLYVHVTDILKFYEVLFCMYCRSLFYLYMHKTQH